MFPVPAPIRRRGVTLIEAVLFISIALGLIVGGIVFYQQASLAARIERQTSQLSAVVQEVRALYQNQTVEAWIRDAEEDLLAVYDSGIRIDNVLVAAGAVPPDIVVPARPGSAVMPGSQLRTVWDGEMSVMVGRFTDNIMGMRITLVDLPRESCIRLVTAAATAIGQGPSLGVSFVNTGTGYSYVLGSLPTSMINPSVLAAVTEEQAQIGGFTFTTYDFLCTLPGHLDHGRLDLAFQVQL